MTQGAIIIFLESHPYEWVTSKEIAEGIGVSTQSVRNSLQRLRFQSALRYKREYSPQCTFWYHHKYEMALEEARRQYDNHILERETLGWLIKEMEKLGLPVLKLESDYDILDRGPLRTRIETFIETLKGR